MTDVILGHPYSGALYAYFADQLQGEYSHTKTAHSYYKTLYGKNYDLYVEISLNLLLLYRNVWVCMADNPLPETASRMADRSCIPEIGLNLLEHNSIDYQKRRHYLDCLCEDYAIGHMLGTRMRIPKNSWWQILDSAIDEALFSAKKRIPLICSYGRRQVIKRIVEIDRPSLEPILPELQHVKFIETYRSITGLAISPTGLDDLLQIKFDHAVRDYGDKLLDVAFSASSLDGVVDEFQVARLIQESMDNEVIAKRYSGAFRWAGNISRIIQEPVLGIAAAAANQISSIGSTEGWYAFRGAVDQAISKNQMMQRVDLILRTRS